MLAIWQFLCDEVMRPIAMTVLVIVIVTGSIWLQAWGGTLAAILLVSVPGGLLYCTLLPHVTDPATCRKVLKSRMDDARRFDGCAWNCTFNGPIIACGGVLIALIAIAQSRSIWETLAGMLLGAAGCAAGIFMFRCRHCWHKKADDVRSAEQ